jgi:hypothetical protein
VTTAIGYAGAGQTAWQLSSPGATTSAILDAGGSRLGLSDGSTQSWLIDDLHGSPVASYSADGSSISGATRYDAYGLRLGSYPAATSPDPWGYGDRLALSPDPAHPLYDFAARRYDPGLGTFTSLLRVTQVPRVPLTEPLKVQATDPVGLAATHAPLPRGQLAGTNTSPHPVGAHAHLAGGFLGADPFLRSGHGRALVCGSDSQAKRSREP